MHPFYRDRYQKWVLKDVLGPQDKKTRVAIASGSYSMRKFQKIEKFQTFLIYLFDNFFTAGAKGQTNIQFVADEHGFRSETTFEQKKQTEQSKPVQEVENQKPNVSQDAQFDNSLDTPLFQVTSYPVSSANDDLPAYVIASSGANNLGLLSAAGLSPLQLGGIASQLSRPSLGLFTNSIYDEEKPHKFNGAASLGTRLPFSSMLGNLMSSIAGPIPQIYFHLHCLPASSNTSNEPQKESNQQSTTTENPTTTEKPTTERTTEKVEQTTKKPQDNSRNLRFFYYKK